MVLSKKARRERKQFRKFRAVDDISTCKKCGRILNAERHHFYCNRCHIDIYGH